MEVLKSSDFFALGEEIKLMECDILNKSNSIHAHEFLEIAYVSEGEGRHIYDDRGQTLRKGDYLILDFCARHSFVSTSEKEMRVINCIFKPVFIDRSLVSCRDFSELLQNYLLPFDRKAAKAVKSGTVFRDEEGKILGLLQSIREEQTLRRPGFQYLMRVYLIELLLFTMRLADADGMEENFPDDIRQVRDYLDGNFTRKVTLSECASLVNLAAGSLCQKYKSATGETITDYLQRRRMDLACRLLASGSDKIPVIAEQCGYSDIRYFSQVFRRVVGTAPLAYRQAKRAGTR